LDAPLVARSYSAAMMRLKLFWRFGFDLLSLIYRRRRTCTLRECVCYTFYAPRCTNR